MSCTICLQLSLRLNSLCTYKRTFVDRTIRTAKIYCVLPQMMHSGTYFLLFTEPFLSTSLELSHVMFLSAFSVPSNPAYTLNFWHSYEKESLIPPSGLSEITAMSYLRLTTQNSLLKVLLSFPHRCMECYPMSVLSSVQHAGTGNTGMPTPWQPWRQGKAVLHYGEKISACKRILFDIYCHSHPCFSFGHFLSSH